MYRIRMDSTRDCIELDVTGPLPPHQLRRLAGSLRMFTASLVGTDAFIEYRPGRTLTREHARGELLKVRSVLATLGLHPSRVRMAEHRPVNESLLRASS